MNYKKINALLNTAEKELTRLDARRSTILKRIRILRREADKPLFCEQRSFLTNRSSPGDKIALFRSLFRGREDVYPRRFESQRTGKSGYQPACGNEWGRGVCEKPKVKCNACKHRDFLPVTDEVIRSHLSGGEPDDHTMRDFTIGVYPMCLDETCWFLAADFDKATWKEDAAAFLETCHSLKVPAALERSRSGNGGHIWFFFSESISASMARKLGCYILTKTMDSRPEIGFDSYDRFFPSQDTMPKGGFGNLIALPLQKKPREKGNSLFLDYDFIPYPDQWEYLSTIRRMNRDEIQVILDEANAYGSLIGVRMVMCDENNDKPWVLPPSGRLKEPSISGQLPKEIEVVLGNQIYIPKDSLSAPLKNRLVRLAAFQNPEFYKAQAMRLPTYNKPRIISCCEDLSKHIGLPRGCLDETLQLLRSLKINPKITDKRFPGKPIDVSFNGVLRPEQKQAANAMLKHDFGVLAATTAFGKTIVALKMIATRGVNTLVLVHRRQLLDQWVARINNFLALPLKEIGQIGGGKRNPIGKIDVAVIQSLSKKGIVDDIVAEYGHLIVDECHHISARSFEIVARQCKAKYVTGLSATVTRKDGHHPIIFMNCGPVRYRVDARKQADIRPFNHRVIVRKTGYELTGALAVNDTVTITELYSALMSDEKRNKMIVMDVVKAIGKNRSPVVLTERRAHLECLAEELSTKVRNVIVLRGGMGKKQRSQLIEKMAGIPDDEKRIIMSTGRYLGEGFDDARLDTLFLTLPVSWRGIIAQYAGRLHRLHDMKKEVIIYDYADDSIPMLARMYQRRCRGYKAIGYTIDEELSNV